MQITRVGRTAFWFVLALFSGAARGEELSCDSSSEYKDDHQKRMQEALRRLVQGYVRTEKISYEAALSDAKLLARDNLPPEIVEEIVAEAVDDTYVYADRLIKGMLNTVSDPDCMSREFDVSQRFNATEAANVMHKCKLLVLKNVFDKEFLQEFKADFTAYIRGLDSGSIPKTGRTTNNEEYFMDKLDYGRWEVLVPKHMADAEIVRNDKVLSVLMNERLLGDSLVLHSMGAAISDAGAKPQDWHTDSDYLFGDSLYEITGVTHHELPAYAITMLVPLLYMTPDHGPTQFCMGSSNLAGLTDDKEGVKLRDESLRTHLYDQPNLDLIDDYTPCKYMRTPQVTFGDVLLFDYQIVHRGGRNVSPDLRSVLYLTYSRFWYKDKGFEEDPDEDEDYEEDEDEEEDELFKQLTRTARFAIPDELTDDDTDGTRLSDEEANLESLGSFRGLPVGNVDF